MYKKIEALVQSSKLTFSGEHLTNYRYYLENDEKSFLENIKEDLKFRNTVNDVYCFDCDEYVRYHLEGEQLVPNIKDCFTKEEVVVEIPVPSGELMMDDWLEHGSELLEHLDKMKPSINSSKGIAVRVEDYATEGVGHFFVGGSSPHVFEKDNKLFIGKNSWSEDDEEIPPVENAQEKGRVFTDLWWVTICDRLVYQQLAQKKFGEEKGERMAKEALEAADVVVQVEPGTYLLKYFLKPSKESDLFATLEKKPE